MKTLPIIINQNCSKHNPLLEISNGLSTPHPEIPARFEYIYNALKENEYTNFITDLINPKEWIDKVHSPEYIDFLFRVSTNSELRNSEGSVYPSIHPYMTRFPKIVNTVAERGLYMFDTYTPIMEDTYIRAVESAACAVTGAKLLKEGNKHVYALSRPPGHHAEKSLMGGYCYFNNCAIAAEYLITNGAKKVAIYDFDLHHGNGIQNIFYDRSDVLYISSHASPEIKFPHFSGWSDEKGEGGGLGYNINYPLPLGTNNDSFHEIVLKVMKDIKNYNPDYLIIAAGFDTHIDDPIGAFKLTTDYYFKLGQEISALGIPTLSVQEGGYASSILGLNVISYLNSFIKK